MRILKTEWSGEVETNELRLFIKFGDITWTTFVAKGQKPTRLWSHDFHKYHQIFKIKIMFQKYKFNMHILIMKCKRLNPVLKNGGWRFLYV